MNHNSSCIICGSGLAVLLFSKDGYPIVKCGHCGLVFVDPRFFPASSSEGLYDEGYFAGGIYGDYIGERNYRLDLFARKLRFVEAHVPVGGKLLDVGCAAGYFLEVAENRGYDVNGVEVAKYATDHIKESLQTKVFTGTLEDARFPKGSFDAITMWDVAEHLPRPVDTLIETHRVLRDGGKLILETVNVSCLNAKILGAKWPLYRPPFHLFYFSINTITKLLTRCGFKVANVEPMQTYSPFHRHKAIRYFDALRVFRKNAFAMSILKRLFADVILVVAKKGGESAEPYR